MISVPNESVYDSSSGIRHLMLRTAPRSLEPLISSLPFPGVDSLDLCCVSIEGKEHIACIDNQASCSILSLDFALKNQIAVEPANVPFTLADGSIAYATGRALLNCAARGAYLPVCEFYILPHCIQPIILGRPFLHESGLLRCPRHTGHEASSPLRQKNMAIHSVEHHCTMRDHRFQSQIRVQIGMKEAQAVPDKGSNQNIMSLAHAHALGYPVEGGQHSRVTVKLANGARIQSHGSIETQFKFREMAGQGNSMRSRFIIIDGHPFDLAFGNPFIKKYRVFDERISDIEWTHVDEENLLLCPIFFCRSSKGGKAQGWFAPSEPEVMDDFRGREMTGIASRLNKATPIGGPAVAAPRMPVVNAPVADAPAPAGEHSASLPEHVSPQSAANSEPAHDVINHAPPTVSQFTRNNGVVPENRNIKKQKTQRARFLKTILRKIYPGDFSTVDIEL